MQVSFLYFYVFLKRVGIAALLFTVCRVLFLIFNLEFFPSFSLLDFVWGIRFDLSAIAWIYLPFLFLQIVPLPFRKHRYYRLLLRILFHLSNTLCLVLNLVDLEYYDFNLRRTTADVLALVGNDSDFLDLLPQFLKDYWHTLLLLPVLIYLTDRLYQKTEPKSYPSKHNYLVQFVVFVFSFALIVIGSRGGVQLRPIGFITASQMTAAPNVPLVLNTPFTFMKSLNKKSLNSEKYFEKNELQHIFSPDHSDSFESVETKRNVVVFILESFAKEYVGWYNEGNGYTPFLDSIMNHSTVFTNAYANGRRSIEALPAIFSGVPNLMTSPYVTSPYAGNRIISLPLLLSQNGYETAFFHGGSNGTMGFDAYADIAGFQNYYGRTEYNNEKDFDGNWGIFDEPFLQFFKTTIDQSSKPFFGAVFTLSSHHPYAIPDKLKDRFPKGSLAIHETIGYSDYALKCFFQQAKKESWYQNTTFIITADHTAQSESEFYRNMVGTYAIPMVVFNPSVDTIMINNNVTQHCDIQSIVLNEIKQPLNYFSFGNNPLSTNNKGFSITLNNGIYQFIYQNHCLQFDGKSTIGFFDIEQDSLLQNNLVASSPQLMIKMERTTKAIIQTYNERMSGNKMYFGADE